MVTRLVRRQLGAHAFDSSILVWRCFRTVKFFTRWIFDKFCPENHQHFSSMNEEVKAELQKQQETMLAKLSAVMDTKVGQMKREL